MNLNKLLEKQIRQYLDDDCLQQVQVQHLINAVNNAYNTFDKEYNNDLNGQINMPTRAEKNIDPAIETQPDTNGNIIATGNIENNLPHRFAFLNEQISERKKAELNLKNSEYHLTAAASTLAQLITSLNNGILLEDENRNVLLANQLFCDIFGIPAPPETLGGKNVFDWAEQNKGLFKYPDKFVGDVQLLLNNKKLVIGDELEMTDGRVLTRDYVPIYVASEYKGHLWKYLDVTTEKETQNELKRLSLVASANENGVAFCDAYGSINWANEGITRLTGYSMEEIIGKKAVELCIGPLSDMDTIKIMLEAFYTGKGFNIEVIHYRKDGSWFWGRLKGQSILDAKGNVKQYFAMIDDISIEKEKEEQLRVLSQIAEDNMNAVIIADAKGCISWVNKSFVKITGYTLEEVIGKRPALMQGPGTDPETMDYMRNQVKEGNPFNCEVLNYTKSGVKHWLRIQCQAIRNSKGEVTSFFALEEDITREKEDKQKLQEYEARFRKAFEKIGDNVWEHDFSTGKTYFSNTRSHLLGYSFEEFTDNAVLWWSRTHDDDRLLLEQNDAMYRKGEIEHHLLEYRIVHKDGSIRWVMDRGVVIELTNEGKPLKIIGTHTDITERKQAEELLQREEQKYRSIIANMNLGLLEVDTEENVIFTNQRFCEMSGYDYDELIGKKASYIYVKGENIELIESKNEARTKRSLDAYEIAVKNKRGQLRWWLISGALRYNDLGELVGSIGIHLDITEQKQLEIDLIEAREQAEQSTRSKEVFLANMSHEIRTPMNAIFGMTNQLTKTNLDGKQRFYLDTINSASENLLVIINDILDLSKIEAGMLNLETISFEPRVVIDRAIQVLMHKAEEKGLTLINLNCDANLSPVLKGDPYRLNQVLLNLISNAVKFTEKGGVDLSCTVLLDTITKQTILVEVKDTGIGMDDSFVNNLFEKFSQEDVSVTRQYGGTGLGMSISKDLVELMGGEIIVKSKKGVGTSVSFKIELAKGNISELPSKETFAANKDMLAGKKILVVDDNNMNRLVAKTILHNYGAIITEAVNGKEAIDLLRQFEIDLVLMDIQMPVMGGMEATKIIREEISGSLAVIALTANAIKGDNEKCIEGGMNAYLSKPFKEQDLLKIVSFWLINQDAAAKTSKSLEAASLPDKLYDLTSIREISRGSEVFVEKMVNMWITQSPLQLAEMEAKYGLGDYKGMAAVAHKMKPGIDNMGIVSLKENIREIEKFGKTGTANDSLEYLLQTVTKNLSEVIEALQKEFEQAVQ